MVTPRQISQHPSTGPADDAILLTGNSLTLEEVVAVAHDFRPVFVTQKARERVRAARDVVDSLMSGEELVYGLNTELGPLAKNRVLVSEFEEFQISTLIGHAVAYGEALSIPVVRAMMIARANGMATGGVGVRVEIIEAIVDLLNYSVHPVVKTGNSVGQADLSEMAQIGLVLVGLGEAEFQGQLMPGAKALEAAGLTPLHLQAKEALGLISANGVTIGQGSIVIADAMAVMQNFNISAALALEAFGANLSIIHPVAAKLKPHPGHKRTSDRLRKLLEGSFLCTKGSARNLQDPLSFRCIPQVHGTLDDALHHIRSLMEIELNSGADNPIVSVEDKVIVSVGNFDVTNLAVAFDTLRLALTQVIHLANERIHKQVWSDFSALPTGLAKPESPLTRLIPLARMCSALTSEAYSLANPVSLSYRSQLGEGVEDHASMAPLAVKQTASLVRIAQRIAALELMISASAIDLRGNPALGVGTEIAYEIVHAYPSFDANVWSTELDRVVQAVSANQIIYWIDKTVQTDSNVAGFRADAKIAAAPLRPVVQSAEEFGK